MFWIVKIIVYVSGKKPYIDALSLEVILQYLLDLILGFSTLQFCLNPIP